MMTRSYRLLVLAVFALAGCSEDSPPVPMPKPAVFTYKMDGQSFTAKAQASYMTSTFAGVTRDYLTLTAGPTVNTIAGAEYGDVVTVSFMKETSAPVSAFQLHELQVFRTNANRQTSQLSYQNAATATLNSGNPWSGTFAGKQVDAQNNVVSSLTQGVFTNVSQ